MVHGWLGIILCDGFPGIIFQVQRKDHGRRLRRLAVKADAGEVVHRVAAAGEINSLPFFRRSGGDAVARHTWVRRQFLPLDLPWIVMINLSHPAFVRRDISQSAGSGVLLAPIHIKDSVSAYRSRVPKNGSSGRGSSL